MNNFAQITTQNSNESDWVNPVMGEATIELLKKFSTFHQDDRTKLINSSVDILKKCPRVDIKNGFNTTGLIIGYVQSGKTASFTTMSALARDNGFAITILISGSSTTLFNQSNKRLIKDLGFDESNSPWVHISNPTMDDSYQALIGTLTEWFDESIPRKCCKSIFITVMKNHTHLRNLVELLNSLDDRFHNLPAMIVDDESDQASLNTEAQRNAKAKQNRTSTTYRRIVQLKAVFHRLFFLQYTATPQANLLINIADSLAPKFHYLLQPGSGYVGGKFFFDELNRESYIRDIPVAQVPQSPGDQLHPPQQLIEALGVYIVGVAIELYKFYKLEKRPEGNRSMLVHPARETDMHVEYLNWVKNILDVWGDLLEYSDDDPDKQDLILKFKESYLDLTKTIQDIPLFEDILGVYLKRAIDKTRVEKINSSDGETPKIDWSTSYSWIIISGQAVDRGTTVNDLTVTYLPRASQNSNADTLQQRARFFGYKKNYIGSCRIFLDSINYQNFQNYVDHEEAMRLSLDQVNNIQEWRRVLLLDGSMTVTRKNILSKSLVRSPLSGWNVPDMPMSTAENLSKNKTITEVLIGNLSFNIAPQQLIGRDDSTIHYLAENIDKDLLINYLKNFIYSDPDDSSNNFAITLLLEQLARTPNGLTIDFYWMAKNFERKRTVDSEWMWSGSSSLFQGKSVSGYIGDSRVRSSGEIITVQLHLLDINIDAESIAKRVPVLAIYVPPNLASTARYLDQ